MRDPDLTPEVELRNARDRLNIIDGLVRAFDDPHAVLDVLVGSDDVEAARRALRDRFGLDENQANAVMDMQFRRTARLERQKILGAHAELVALVQHLESRT